MFRLNATDEELDEEMRLHLARDVEANIARGMSRNDAWAAARRGFGNLGILKDDARETWRWQWLESLTHDLRFGFRGLRRSRAFTVTTVSTLALAIAANTTVLSVIDQVLVRSLPYDDAGRVGIMLEGDATGAQRTPSYLTFLDWQQQSQTIAGMAFVRGTSSLLRTADGSERIGIGSVTPGFFGVVGVHPMMGRVFIPEEERGAASDVAVISYELWRRRFGGDPSVVGRTIDFDSSVMRVVGILPAGVTFFQNVDVWRPIAGKIANDPALANRNLHVDSRVIGRLKPGVPLEQLLSEFRVIQAREALSYPAESSGWTTAELLPMRAIEIGDAAPMLLLLGGAVLVVLLIASANVSNLSLVRAIARERELAVRKALGATTSRLSRLLLAESVIIGSSATAIGLLATTWAIRAIRASAPPELPRVSELTIDWRVFGVALVLTLVVSVLVGVTPLLRLRSRHFADPLRQGRSGGTGADATRIKRALSVAQLGLAIALLLSGGLLVQSLRRIRQVDLGFDPRRVLEFPVFPQSPRYDKPADALALYQRLLDALGAVPGVASVAVINHVPLGGASAPTRVLVPGRNEESRGSDQANYKTVSAAYLRTVHLSLLHGRWFTDTDVKSRGDGVVISESVATRYWPGRDPTGESLTIFGSSQARADFGKPQPSHVIGVVADIRSVGQAGIDRNADIYVPFTRATWPWTNVVVRTMADAATMIPALQRAVLAIDPAIPVAGRGSASAFAPMESLFSRSLAARRYVVWLLSGFATTAFLLALVGVYGVTAYGVSQRKHEFGVRLALGATQRNILMLILMQGLFLALVGSVVGIAGGLALTRLLTTLLYGTTTTDSATFAIVPLTVATTVLIACAIPARRAATLDPMIALRAE